MSKRILFVTGSQSRSGGTERACANVANHLALRRGYDVAVLSAMEGLHSFFEIEGSIVLTEIYPTRRSLQIHALDFFRRLRAEFKRMKPDIIIIVESFLAAFVLPAAAGLSIKTINWEHFAAHISLGTPLRRLARHMAARCCTHVVVLTEADRAVWLKKYRMREGRISVIGNMNPMHRHTEERIALSGKERVVLAVGRLEREKGFDLLLNAWARIDAASRRGWKLRIVGEGGQSTELRELTRQLSISDEVDFAGQSADVASEYRSAGIFVLPSRFEGFGLVLIEAMTFALPIVSFDCQHGPRELIDHQVSGILVEYPSVDEMAMELGALMSSPDARLRIGLQGRIGVQRYAPEKIAAAWHALLAG